MKYFIQIIIFTIPIIICGQKWNLVQTDFSKEYPYSYTFSFQNLDDENIYSIALLDKNEFSSIRIIDIEGEPVLTLFTITNIESKKVHNFATDIDGKLDVALDSGFYKLELRNPLFDDAEIKFRVGEGTQLDILISLGKSPEIGIYGIESKLELEETEILGIIDCVNKNRNKFNESCSDMKRYRINMHL